MTTAYDPARAWLRGLLYFAGCWAVAVPAGVSTLLANGLTATDGAWFGWTGLALVVAGAGYWWVWPQGTATHGRELRIGWAAGFGLAWGASEGALAAAVWLLIDGVIETRWLATAAAFLVVGGASAAWHAAYWDRRIAPDHNLPDWNRRKVLLVHAPFLAATLAHLALYEQGLVVLLAYSIALTGAAVSMRMPGPLRRTPHT